MKRIAVLFLLCLMTAPAVAAPVQEVVSDAGVTAWLVEEHSLPLIAARVAFREAGSAHDPAGKEGRAAMAGELLSEGAGDRDALAFNQVLEAHAIRLGFGAEGDIFSASLETLTEHKELAFSLLADALTRPRFTKPSIEEARAQALAQIKQLAQSPEYQASLAYRKAVFGDHPYGRPSIGTEESVRRLTREDFTSMARRYFTRKNVMIAVVGDISAAELKTLLDTSLRGLPDRFDPEMTVPEVSFPAKPADNLIVKDVPQTAVMFGLPGLRRSDPDYMAAYVLNYIIGSGEGLNSLLMDEIREKRGLSYAVSMHLAPQLHGATWNGNFASRSDAVGQAVDVLRTTLERVRTEGIAEDKLTDAKRYLTGSFVHTLDSNADVANFLISMQLHALGKDYLDKRNQLIEAVTMGDIRRVTARLLDPARLVIVRVGKAQTEASKP